VQDIKPSSTMQAAMEEQAAAERARRATVTRADGEKAASILQAEGRLEASRRDAEATVVLAQANQQAIEKIAQAIGQNDLPVTFLLGEKYIESMARLAASPNAKTVVLPGDVPGAVKGLIGALNSRI
jgi:regulator of protease activity HflC (stomatin/prohibitin superfamily)